MTVKRKVLICLSLVFVLLVAVVICACKDDTVNSIKFNKYYLELNIGERTNLTVQADGSLDGKDRIWRSSDESVATVNSQSGEIKAIASGSAYISLQVDDKTAVCTVVVKSQGNNLGVAVSDVTLNAKSIELDINGKTMLMATVAPSNATDKTVTWESMDTSIATINEEGVVTAVSSGVTVITASAGNKIAICQVLVTDNAPPIFNSSLQFKTLKVNGYVVTGSVASSVNEFSFADEIFVTEGTPNYMVYTDIECRNAIPSKVASLQTGDNMFYILTQQDNKAILYRITIRRLSSCMVTFDTDDADSVNSRTVDEGTEIVLPVLERTGYVFAGWTLNGQIVDNNFTVTSSVELRAKFIANKYAVNLVSNGCDVKLVGAGNYAYGDSVTVTAEKRLGYSFGWYHGDDKVSDDYSFTFDMPTSDISYAAKYKLDPVVEMSNLDFESSAEAFVINGFDDKGPGNILVIPKYTTQIKSDAFSSISSQYDIQTVIWNANNLSVADGCHIFRDTIIRNFLFGNTITSFPSWTFCDCYGIENLRYDGKIEDWCKIVFADEYSSPLRYSVNWYVENTLTTKIVIPESVTRINDYAFLCARKITEVKLPQGLTEIGKQAFTNCSSLTTCNLPQSLTLIGEGAFAYSALEGMVVIPDNIVTIEDSVFDNTKINGVFAPVSVRSIDSYAFRNTPLSSVYYKGNALQWNEISVGVNNSEIDKATVYFYSEELPEKSGDYWHYVDGQIEAWNLNCASVTVNKTVDGKTVADKRMFYDISEQVTLTADSRLGYVFLGWYCNNELLTEDLIYTFDAYDFYIYLEERWSCDELLSNFEFESTATEFVITGLKNRSVSKITIPSYVTGFKIAGIIGVSSDVYNNYFASVVKVDYLGSLENWCGLEFYSYAHNPLVKAHYLFINGKLIDKLIIPESVMSINDYVFYGGYFDSITFGKHVKHIGTSAFGNIACENFYYKDSFADWCCTEFGGSGHPFANCNNTYIDGELIGDELIIPEGVEEIGAYAFAHGKFSSVIIPSTVKTIGNRAFMWCNNLQSADISAREIGEYAFFADKSLKSVTLNEGVTIIGKAAFSNCAIEGEMIIPDSVTELGEMSFLMCKSLTKIVVGNGVTRIPKIFAASCSSLTDIVIPLSVTEFDSQTFISDKMLQSLYYEGTLAQWCAINFAGSYGHYWFKQLYCNGELIEGELKLPQGISEVKQYAFYGLENISSIIIPEGVMTVSANAFADCANVTTVILPSSLTQINKAAFSYCASLSEVFYCGTAEQWKQLNVESSELLNATVYFYSVDEPALNADGDDYEGTYWHYVDEKIAVWRKQNDD